ncbi:MAG: carbohydrate binding domain-containing protein [Armatimonadota bacterium]
MRLILMICLTVTATTAAFAAPALTERPLLVTESFEGEPDGWVVHLNRGGEGSMATVADGILGRQCLQVTPTRTHAPDDRQLASNVHLRYETVSLNADTPYRLSVWMRATSPKFVTMKVRRRDVEESVSARAVQVGPSWQQYTFDFTLPEDYPDGTPQFLLADDLTPVFFDAMTISETPDDSLAPADYLRFNEAVGGPSASVVRFVSNFDDDAHGWLLHLNRGARAEMAHDAEAGVVRVTPEALCAPDDQPFETNIHLKYEGLALKAGVDYVYSARLRAEEPRNVGLRLRPGGTGSSHGVASVEVGPEWQTFEEPFTLEEDMPSAIAQVLIGGETAPVWVDDIVIREASCGDTPPEGVIERGALWLRPEVVEVEGGDGPLAGMTELARDLPESFRLQLAADMFGADALRLALVGDDGAMSVDIGENVVVRDAAGNELLREALASSDWAPGEALTVTLERTDGELTAVIGETHALTLDDADFDRVMIGASGEAEIAILKLEGAEMLPLERPDGSTEKQEYTDPVTGNRIARLTHSPYNDKHSYYDVSPWSPDGSKIFFTSALPGERDATVYVMDADGTNIRKVGEGDSFSMHTGAFPQWGPDGTLYFHTGYTTESGERQRGMKRVWLDEDRVEKIPISARQISLATGDLLWMENRRGEDDPVRGLYAAEADGSDPRMLIATEDIEALSPTRDRHDECASLGLTNCKWSPDGTKVMVVLVGSSETGSRLVKEIYIANADGSDLKFVMTFAHHHMWHPNSQQVIANCDDGLFIVNYDGTGKRKISDLAQGHPSFSPDGSMIATDCFGGEYSDMVVLIDPETGEVEPLASCPTVHGRSHEVGTHPHPSWAPDGKSVIYDSDQEGHVQVYQAFVE